MQEALKGLFFCPLSSRPFSPILRPVEVKKGDVVGIGALNLDLFYEVEDLSLLGLEAGREVCCGAHGFSEVAAKVNDHGRLVSRSPGGSAANTIYTLARLGFSTGFIGKVGEDVEGDELLSGMEGVDLSRVKREGKTGLCLVVLDSKRDRALVVEPNANDTLRFEDLDLDYIRGFRMLHMSAFVGDGPFEAQRRLVEVLPSEVMVSLDPGELYAKRGLDALRGILRRCWAVFITEGELLTLTRQEDLRRGAKEVLKAGAELVVCKRGPRGAMLFDRVGSLQFAADAEEGVVDNTGAGDVFDAGFLAGVLKGMSLERCLEVAHRLAAKSLKGFGREAYPTKEDFLRCV